MQRQLRLLEASELTQHQAGQHAGDVAEWREIVQ
jgi:hypothetical protein